MKINAVQCKDFFLFPAFFLNSSGINRIVLSNALDIPVFNWQLAALPLECSPPVLRDVRIFDLWFYMYVL